MRIFNILLLILFYQVLHSQEFIEKTFIRSYTTAELTSFAGIPVSYPVDVYKIRYTSTMLDGSPDTLSGLLSQPRSEKLLHPLHVYCHGTVDSREDVPSRLSFESIIPTIFASFGYNTIAPDYLGYGDSNAEVHPYVHADSEAKASYDMLRAMLDFSEEVGIRINDQLFISGYSQGGHAGMALHRFLENNNIEVTAASHMSGPYSISEDQINFTLSEREYNFVSYLPFTSLSYQEVYGNIGEPKDIYKESYATEIEKFADGELTLFQLNDRLITMLKSEFGASIPRRMIRDSILNELFNNPNSTMNQALRENDVYDWAPKAPTRLYYCKDDDQVGFQNALTALEKMRLNGSESISAINISDGISHTECVTPAITFTIFFFNSLQNILSNSNDFIVSEGVQVYPNPVENVLYIKDEKFSTGRIRIYDFTGKAIKDEKISNGQVTISQIPAGPYILEWITDDYTHAQKLIIR